MYKHIHLNEFLPEQDSSNSVMDSLSLQGVFDSVGFPEEYREQVICAYVVERDGEYIGVFFSESSRPWDNDAEYHPLPYYITPEVQNNKYWMFQEVWREDNPLYH